VVDGLEDEGRVSYARRSIVAVRFAVAMLLFVAACAHKTKDPYQSDWCGTDRANLRYFGAVLAECKQGALYACETAAQECARGESWLCVAKTPAPDDVALAECFQRELEQGVLCEDTDAETVIAKYPRALSLYERGCADHKWQACYEAALLHEHRGDKIDIAAYKNACDAGMPGGCKRLEALAPTTSATQQPAK
jgi:hypothetical protein